MSDEDEGKWQALRNELSQPDRSLPPIYEGADVLEPEESDEPAWRKAYPNDLIYTRLSDEEMDAADDLVFEPYEGEAGRGLLVTRRGEQ